MKRIVSFLGYIFLLSVCYSGYSFIVTDSGRIFPYQFVWHLAVGWLLFLRRVGPQITIDPWGVVTAVLCLIVLSIGLHVFLRFLAPATWRPRWTVMLLAGIVVMFVAGMSAVGAVWQSSWLITASEPLVEKRPGPQAQSATLNDLKHLGIGLENYVGVYQHYPAGNSYDAAGTPLHGWQTHLMPYMFFPLYETLALDLPWNHPKNESVFKNRITEYWYPSSDPKIDDQGFYLTNFAANERVIGTGKPLTIADITDGTANTMLVGQVAGNYPPWGQPGNFRDLALGINQTPAGFGSQLREGAAFVFADGSVRFLSTKTSRQVLRALSTPNGGEDLPAGWDD
jgi:hypothetical protein